MTEIFGSVEHQVAKDETYTSSTARPIAASFGIGRSQVGNLIAVSDAVEWYDVPVIPERTVSSLPVYKIDLGSPVAAEAAGLVSAATSTELPNAATKTYTTADSGATPFDDASIPTPEDITYNGAAVSVWPLDVPRNLVAVVTHATAIVAMSVTVTGYDEHLVKVVETLAVTATGTTKTVAGKKAIKYVQSIAITSAGNATTNTLNLGWGDVLGLPHRLPVKSNLQSTYFNQIVEATLPTTVVADATAATATTGDVRGTIDLDSALDGSAVSVYMAVDTSTRTALYGIAQYGG